MGADHSAAAAVSTGATLVLGAGIGAALTALLMAGTQFWLERVYLPRIAGEQ